jgi:glycosyltransferase involved in cell wall biosynthesis
VHFHPPLQPPELAALLRSLDLFVIPSHQEGLCIAALEAMACGLPVVSTRCGGPEDFVLADRTGELVDSDPAAMAAAISAIASDRQRRDRLAGGALEWVQRHAIPAVARATFRHHLAATWPAAGIPTVEGG